MKIIKSSVLLIKKLCDFSVNIKTFREMKTLNKENNMIKKYICKIIFYSLSAPSNSPFKFCRILLDDMPTVEPEDSIAL